MGIHIQWFGDTGFGVVRGGSTFERFGDKFTFVCNLERTGDEVYVFAALASSPGEFNRKVFRDIQYELNLIGVRNATWERLKDDDKKIVKVKT